MPNKITIHTRWMIRRDMPEVQAIENMSFEYPWSDDDFLRCLRQRNCIGMVAEFDERIVGFMIYEIHKTRIQMLNFAVHGDCRHKGVGRQLLENIIHKKLSAARRSRIVLEISEKNLDAQLFFHRMGFRATSVLRDFFEDADEDAYLFEYRLSEVHSEMTVVNRVKD